MAATTKKDAEKAPEEKAEARAPASAPAPPRPPREAMSLQEKFLEIRRAVPKLAKQRHSEGVEYKFNKIDAIYEATRSVMDEIGVNCQIVSETTEKRDELGNPVYWQTMITKTRYGDRLIYL
jgi:hypothetical protein